MASKPINIAAFPGMNNVSKAGIRTVLNMDAGADQFLTQRDGYALWLAMIDPHSLVADSMSLFCAAVGTASIESLWNISSQGDKTEVCVINGKGHPLSYIFTPDRVYISSRAWNGIYEYLTGVVRAWGAAYSDDPASLIDATSSEPMMTLNVTGAPYMENLCMAGSRIFGSVGNRVYYNDPPFAFEMFRPDTFLEFDGDIVMIAKSAAGLYFASTDKTWFAQGFDPAGMNMSEVGTGALPGSLQYLPNFRGVNDVPIWTERTGIFAGVNGRAVPVTEERLKFDAQGQAASLQRVQDGVQQYLTSFPQHADVGFGDSATCEVVRNGKLIT